MGPRRGDEEMLALATAGDVAAAVRRFFGDSLEARGVIHTLEVAPRDRGRYVEIEAGQEVPASRHGLFLRGLARARADAILTTDAVLRRRPDLDHRLATSGAMCGALDAWRREALGKRRPPVSLVLTSGRGVDLDHPVFRHWTRPLVYTTHQAQWELESRAVDSGVEVVGVDEPTARGAVEFLRRAFGAATLAVEMPPRDAGELYDAPPAVDEVLLSAYRSTDLLIERPGDPYLTAEELDRRFPERSRPLRVAAANGEWSFQRFRR